MAKDYQKYKEKYKQRAVEQRLNQKISKDLRLKNLISKAKDRAKRKNIEFNILPQDIKWNDVCPVLRIPIVLDSKTFEDSPSIDRIDNNRGYIKGNVRLISNRANKLKNTMTKNECSLLLENWSCI
jgi:hypothetical protein